MAARSPHLPLHVGGWQPRARRSGSPQTALPGETQVDGSHSEEGVEERKQGESGNVCDTTA